MIRAMPWFLFSALAAPCDPSAMAAALTRAESASQQQDAQAVQRALAQAEGNLSCAGPKEIARYFRGEALLAGLTARPAAVDKALEASLAAYPLLPDSASLLATPPLRAALHRAQEKGLAFRAGRSTLVNGVRTPLVPVARHVGRDGRGGVRWAGVALSALAAGAYGGAWVARKQFDATEGRPAVERLPSYRTTNGLSLGAVGLAAAGGTLLTVGFVL